MATITTSIPYVDWPVTGDGKTLFDTKNDALPPQLQALADNSAIFVAEANALRDEVNGFQLSASASAVAAANAQTATEGFRDEAEAFKDGAEAAAVAVQGAAGLPTVGSDGDILTLINAATNQVAFTSVPIGGLVPLATYTLSGDTAADITNLDTLGFDDYYAIIDIEGSSAGSLTVRVSTDNGATFEPTGGGAYLTVETKSQYTPPSTTNTIVNSSQSTAVISSFSVGYRTVSYCRIGSLSSSYTSFRNSAWAYTAGSNRYDVTDGLSLRTVNEANNAIQFIASGAATMTGTIKFYGVNAA